MLQPLLARLRRDPARLLELLLRAVLLEPDGDQPELGTPVTEVVQGDNVPPTSLV